MVNSRLDGGGSDEGREIFRRSEVFILKHGGEGTPVADSRLSVRRLMAAPSGITVLRV
jgi:hypothetical protein